MTAINYYGLSYCFTPRGVDINAPIKDEDADGNPTELDGRNYTISNNSIFFLKEGDHPWGHPALMDQLYSIQNSSELVDQFGASGTDDIVLRTPAFDLKYTYDIENKRRIIRKVPINAEDLTNEGTGTITYAAIVLHDDRDPANPNEYIFFTDRVGEWGDENAIIIIDSLDCTADEANIFKDMSLVLRDTSTYEPN